MSNAIVSNVYRYVIDDVINQVRGDFEDMGIDDTILQELQRSWESKVARSRVANFGFKDGEYYNEETGNTAEAAPSGATQAAGPNSNTVPVSNNTARNLSTNTDPSSALQYPSEYGQQPAAASLANLATAASRQQQQFQNNNTLPPPQQQQQRMIPDPSTLVNQYQQMQQQQQQQQQQMQPNLPELQLPGSRPNNLPQNDGSNDSELTSTEQIDQHIHDIILQSSQPEEQCEISFTASSFSGEPLALDSLPDSVKQLMKDAKSRALLKKKSKSKRISQLDGGEGEDNSDDGEGTTPRATTTTTTATGAAAGDNDDINSDLDDTDEDDDDGEGGEEIEHIILCLYDKVTRTKNKWKCILKDGIMLVNGRDYLFHRANGDFEW